MASNFSNLLNLLGARRPKSLPPREGITDALIAQAREQAGLPPRGLTPVERGTGPVVDTEPGQPPNLPPPLPSPAPRIRAAPPSSPGIPGGERESIPGMPAPQPERAPYRPVLQAPPGYAPSTDPMDTAYRDFVDKGPQGAKGHFLEALRTALVGFLQGAANNPDDPLASGIGGAIAGGATGAISPEAGRAIQFEKFQKPRIEERERREQERQDRARAIRGDEARIRHIESETERNRRPPIVQRRQPVRSDRGMLDPETNQIIPGTEPLQKEKTDALRQGPDGNYYDVRDPQQREQLRQLNAKLPRDKFGRFISRPDERAAARIGAGGGKGAKAQADFERTKAALDDAVAQGDEEMAKLLRRRLQNQAANLATKYGGAAAFPETSGLPPGIGALTPQKTATPTRARPPQKRAVDPGGIR